MSTLNLLIRNLAMVLGALALFSVNSMGQTEVSGIVSSPDGLPLPGVAVMQEGTSSGTVTDIDGRYNFSFSGDAPVMVVSCIGYQTAIVPINGRNRIDVTLEEAATELDETVVVGYATGNRRSISGSVQRLTTREMNTGYISNPLDALQGKVPGMIVTQSGGSVLGTPTVRIRGTSSLTGGSDPLVVIDGAFSDLDTFYTIPVDDIQEITMLKDASETAQYGSRGAAGVIVVTTKRGEEGTATVDYNGQFGISMAYKNIDILTADEWRNVNNTYFNGIGTDMGYNTNWVEWIQNKVVPQNSHSISLTQGSKTSSMRASVSVIDRQGTVRGARNTNYSASFAASQAVLDNKLRFELNSRFSRNDRNNPSYSWTGAVAYNPTFPSFRNPETGLWDLDPGATQVTHPGESGDRENNSTSSRLMVNGRASWNIIEGLTLSAFGSYNQMNFLQRSYTPNNISASNSTMGSATVSNRQIYGLMGNVQLSYVKELGKSEINALLLAEAQSTNMFASSATATGFGTNDLKYNNLEAGALVQRGDNTSSASDSRLLSYMARLNYMYDNRYVITANFRADGSSKLGINNKWGFFPSVSGAWIISNEQFMKDWGAFSTLKLRAGYGVTGNQNGIDAYTSIEQMVPTGTTEYNGKTYVTYGINSNANPDLKWETKYTFDIGVDFSTLGSRLRGTIDYYRSTTKDMLYTYTVPVPPFTYQTLLANIGEMTNNGFEVALTGDIIKTNDWGLTIGANVAYQQNKLISLTGEYNGETLTPAKYVQLQSAGAAGLTQNWGVTYMTEGYPVGLFILPIHDGFAVDENGHRTYQFKDVDGNGEIDTTIGNDRDICGQVMPKVTASLNLNLRYKDFDFSLQATGAFGHKIYNMTALTLADMSGFPIYNISPTATDLMIYGKNHSSYWLEDGDYVNIGYVSVGYNLPIQQLGIKWLRSLRVALSCNNLATITGYSGLTPMIDSMSLNGGIDNTVDPIMRTYAIQLSVKF